MKEFFAFSLIFILWSLANGLFWASLDVLVLKTDKGQCTGRRLSLYQALRFLGLAVGYVVTGWAIAETGFRMIHEAGDGLLAVIMYLGIFRLFTLERIGGNSGFVRTVTMLGMATGALVFAPLGERFGYRLPLWSSGVLLLLLVLPLIKLLAAGNRGGAPSLGGTHC